MLAAFGFLLAALLFCLIGLLATLLERHRER